MIERLFGLCLVKVKHFSLPYTGLRGHKLHRLVLLFRTTIRQQFWKEVQKCLIQFPFSFVCFP